MDVLVDSFVSTYAFTTMLGGNLDSDDDETSEGKQVAGIPVDVLLGSGTKHGDENEQSGGNSQYAGLAVPAGLVLDSRLGNEYKKYNSTHEHYDGGNGNYSVVGDDLFDSLYNSVAKERNRKRGSKDTRKKIQITGTGKSPSSKKNRKPT